MFSYDNYRYSVESFVELKQLINCFNSFEHRIVEGVVFKYNNIFFLDFGFRSLVKIKTSNLIGNSISIRNIRFSKLCNNIYFNFFKIKQSNINFYNNWYILKKAFQYNCFVIGRFLNLFNRGSCIGVFGFIGYTFKKNLLSKQKRLTSIYIITKINFITKEFLVSQKVIKKLAYRSLFKISSLIVYISNN